jgi:hypothetical protein
MKFLTEVWKASKAVPLTGTTNRLASKVKAYTPGSATAPTNGTGFFNRRAQVAQDKLDTLRPELDRVNAEWNTYRNTLSRPQQWAASTAKWGTGVVRDAPRALLYHPSATMTATLGLPIAADVLSGGKLNVDPYNRVGQLAFNSFGDPRGVARQGFMQGLDAGVGTSLDHFQNLGFADRFNYLMQGGAQNFARQNALNRNYQSALGSGTVNQQFQPGSAISRLLSGNFDKDFYRDRVYSDVGTEMSKYAFIKKANKATLIAAGGTALRNVTRATPPPLPKKPFVSNRNKGKVVDVYPEGTGMWANMKYRYNRLPVPVKAVGHFAPYALTGGAAYMMGKGGYDSAHENATMGGMEAGYDTGLQQVGSQMGGLDLLSQIGALFAPQQAAQSGYDRYMQMRGQLGGGIPQQSPQGVSTMYYYPNGEARY